MLIRLLFFSLPPRLQLVLEHVRKTPFSDARLLPDPIWQPDTDYLMITRPVQNYEQFGSAGMGSKIKPIPLETLAKRYK